MNSNNKSNKAQCNISSYNETLKIEEGLFVEDLSNTNNEKHSLFNYNDIQDNIKGKNNVKNADLKYWNNCFSWDQLVEIANKYIFGFKKFRTNQKEIINAMLDNKDIFVNMPTGGGKSLSFQLTAAISYGVTLVIMPLISLIIDQISYLDSLGIKSLFIKDDDLLENNFIYNNFEKDFNSLDNNNSISVLSNQIKLIFLTPEKLFTSNSTINALKILYNKNLINRIVIDEAHCISQWGKGFRPDYLNLKYLKIEFKNVPILAMTATASKDIREETINILNLRDCLIFRSSYNRHNIFLEVRDKKKFNSINTNCNVLDIKSLNSQGNNSIYANIRNFIYSHNYQNSSGIIYCSSIKDCESISNKLNIEYKLKTGFYHSKINESLKKIIQSDFMENKINILVATIAFGMGINKKDIRFIIHYSLPKSFENYYQEIGRSGRDGCLAHALLYYNPSEKTMLARLIGKTSTSKSDFKLNTVNDNDDSDSDNDNSDIFDKYVDNDANTIQNNSSIVKIDNLRKVNRMILYCEDKIECRRVLALKYFDEIFTKEKCNFTCDNCCSNYVYLDNKNMINYSFVNYLSNKTYLSNYNTIITINATEYAFNIVSFINDLSKFNIEFTLLQAANYLKGNKLNKFKNLEFKIKKFEDYIDKKTHVSYFNKFCSWEIDDICRLIRTLIVEYYIKEDLVILNENPSCFLELDYKGMVLVKNTNKSRKYFTKENSIKLSDNNCCSIFNNNFYMKFLNLHNKINFLKHVENNIVDKIDEESIFTKNIIENTTELKKDSISDGNNKENSNASKVNRSNSNISENKSLFLNAMNIVDKKNTIQSTNKHYNLLSKKRINENIVKSQTFTKISNDNNSSTSKEKLNFVETINLIESNNKEKEDNKSTNILIENTKSNQNKNSLNNKHDILNSKKQSHLNSVSCTDKKKIKKNNFI